MMILELDVFYLTKEQCALEDNGVDVPFKDLDTKRMTFYSIDNVCPRMDEPDYTIVMSSGVEFTCNERYDIVRNKVQEASIFKFN